MNDVQLTKEDLIIMRENLDLDQAELAEMLAISKSYLSKLETGAVPITSKVAAKLIKKIERVKIKTESIETYLEHLTASEPITNYARITSAGRASASNPAIRVRNVLAAMVDQLGDGVFDVFVVEGASMEKSLAHGDLLICQMKTIHDVQDGHVYVIVTNRQDMAQVRISKTWVKRCYYRSKAGYLKCKSDNLDSIEPYHTFSLRSDEIEEIWYPRKVISSQISDPNRDIYEKLNEIESRLEFVEAELNLENQ